MCWTSAGFWDRRHVDERTMFRHVEGFVWEVKEPEICDWCVQSLICLRQIIDNISQHSRQVTLRNNVNDCFFFKGTDSSVNSEEDSWKEQRNLVLISIQLVINKLVPTRKIKHHHLPKVFKSCLKYCNMSKCTVMCSFMINVVSDTLWLYLL